MTSHPLQPPSDTPPGPSAPGGDATSAERFTDKWRARWPEWRIGQVFLPPAQREVAAAWFALLQEFTDAAWTGADATPGLAKLAWWNEELIGWAKGARRHPLAPALQRLPADWRALAASLRSLQATRDDAPGSDPEPAGLDGFAAAVAAAESGVFPGDPSSLDSLVPPSFEPENAVRGIVVDLLAVRAVLHGDADVATRLVRHASLASASGVRARRLQSAYVGHRLRQVAHGAAVESASPWRSLLLSWRAARGS